MDKTGVPKPGTSKDDFIVHLSARIADLEAGLAKLRDYGLEFEDTGTVTIALEPWKEVMALLPMEES